MTPKKKKKKEKNYTLCTKYYVSITCWRFILTTTYFIWYTSLFLHKKTKRSVSSNMFQKIGEVLICTKAKSRRYKKEKNIILGFIAIPMRGI